MICEVWLRKGGFFEVNMLDQHVKEKRGRVGGRQTLWGTGDQQKPERSFEKDIAQTEDWLHEEAMRDLGIRKRLTLCKPY